MGSAETTSRLRYRLHRALSVTALMAVSASACAAQVESAGTSAASNSVTATDGTVTTAVTETTAALAAQPLCSDAPAGGPTTIGIQHTVGDRTELAVAVENSSVAAASSETPITIESVEVTDDGTRLVWTSGATVLDGLEMPEGVEFSLDDLPTQHIEYRLDADGYLASIENIEELRASSLEALELLDEFIPDETQQSIATLYAGLDDEQIALLLAAEVGIYHGLDGLPLIPGERFEDAGFLPNGLGGEPFPAIATLSVAEDADEDGCVDVALITTPDPEHLERILFASVEEAFGTGMDEAELLGAFDVRNQLLAKVDPGTGRVLSIVASQTIKVGLEERSETTTITDVTNR